MQTLRITYYKQGKLDVRRTVISFTKHYIVTKLSGKTSDKGLVTGHLDAF